MLIEVTGRHIAIASREQAVGLVSVDRGFWHVVSLQDPGSPPFPGNAGALSVHSESFRDIEHSTEPFSPTPPHIERIFAYIDSLDRSSPILIHCAQGLSRSPAVALAIVARSLHAGGVHNPVPAAIEVVLRLRAVAAPNLLVTRMALELFLTVDEAESGLHLVNEDARFAGNRFKRW